MHSSQTPIQEEAQRTRLQMELLSLAR